MRMSAEQQPSDLKNADVPTSSPMKFTSESSAPVEKTWKDIPHVPNPIALLDEMLTSGFVPTPSQWREMSILIAKWKPTSFPDLLNRIPHSVKPDPQIWNAGIWCQTESKNALDLFHQMKKFTHPNPQTWNVLFASLKKEDEEAPALIEEALKKNKDSLTRWSSLLLFTKLGQSTRALEIFRTLQAEDHVTLENWELFLRALWSAKETETALALFQEIPNPTPQLWSTMIQEVAVHQGVEEASNWVSKLSKVDSRSVNVKLFRDVLSRLRSPFTESDVIAFQKMLRRFDVMHVPLYHRLIQMYISIGRKDLGQSLFGEMQVDGPHPQVSSWEALFELFREQRRRRDKSRHSDDHEWLDLSRRLLCSRNNSKRASQDET
eukprot:TRINITY_DN7783_c0_g1_i4.p1 TRINITY_DN7783_c0_g1~~TRINITY_DN7783_c0_g1_i4.p1  ORF type:complete len:378 (-),score=76.71 TRINITY_DN7783_c0_g1_i4:1462-2595(-)